MSAKDAFHQVVKTALQTQGWSITADPLEVRWGAVEMYVDLAAEKIIGAERDV